MSLLAQARNLLHEAYVQGRTAGLREGITRLEFLACTVPSTVTKAWLLAEAKRQAEAMQKMLREESSCCAIET